MVRQLLSSLALTATLVLSANPAAACGKVLVSGYYSTVHIYDGCTGGFLRTLDQRSRLQGAQAVRLHNNMLYVVAEEHNSIQRYRADTLEFVDTFISVSGNPGITGVAIGPDGDVYLGGYNSDNVLRFDGTTGAAKGEVISRGSGMDGPDNGLVFGPDGKLYVPGFNSNNVLRWDPATRRIDTFIGNGSGGLRRTRGILFEPDGSGVLVSSEGSNQILRYRLDGSFDKVLSSFDYGPNGMDYDSDGSLLVTGFGGDLVESLDPKSGARKGILVNRNSGGLDGATFLTVLPAASPTLDLAQIGSQFWLTGAGIPAAAKLEVELQSAQGTAFGAAFDPQQIVNRRWGELSIEFESCDRAQMSWRSSDANSAGFGDGGYAIERIAPTRASEACNAQGFDPAAAHDWMAGSWFGGPARNGEGFFFDVLANGVVVVAFFTHRPTLASQ